MRRGTSIGLLAGLPLLRPGRSGAQERRLIRAAGPPNDGFKAMYYGVRSGIFAKYGLDVEITAVKNGVAVGALIAGDIEVAMVNIVTLIQGHLKGIPISMLSPNYLVTVEKPMAFILVPKDSPIRAARDLNSKGFGVPGLGELSMIAALAWIDQNGGDSKSLRVVEVVASATIQFLEQGRVDAAILVEPFASQAVATGKVRILAHPYDVLGKRFQGGAYVVMEPVVQKNFETMTRLAQGLHEAELYTNNHPTETVEMVASYSGASPEVIAKMNRATDPEYVDPRNFQPVIDVLAKYGAIDRTFPATEIVSSAALKMPR